MKKEPNTEHMFVPHAGHVINYFYRLQIMFERSCEKEYARMKETILYALLIIEQWFSVP